MKSISLILIGLTISVASFSQELVNKIDTVFASTNKTTTLVFPHDITYCDIGNEDFGFEKAGKLLLLKCATEEAAATTLIVIYGNGANYHGTLAYKSTPPQLFIQLKEAEIPKVPNKSRIVKDSTVEIEKQIVAKRLNIVLANTKLEYRSIGVNDTKEKLSLALHDLKNDGDHYYFKLYFMNNSKFNYDIDMVEFVYLDPIEGSKDQKQRKNEYAVASNGIDLINGKESKYLAYAIKKFMLSKKGEIQIIFREKNGTRAVNLSLPFSLLVESQSLK